MSKVYQFDEHEEVIGILGEGHNLEITGSSVGEEFAPVDNDADSVIGLPVYEESQQRHGQEFLSEAHVRNDGRVEIDFDTTNYRVSKLLERALKDRLDNVDGPPPQYVALPNGTGNSSPPMLNIVIQLVGSRGDVQPFVIIGRVLQKFGHRVRIATHQKFENFVQDAGLEFFSIGGDPEELMSYMVKNPGLLPSMDSVMRGEVQQKREIMRQIMEGCWRSCIEAGDGLNPQPSGGSVKPGGDLKPFVADVIIANPPSFAHIHCAERLGVPLHIMFTMPWSPTQAFAHPLTNVKSPTTDTNLTNYLSYILVEMMTWQGIGSVINSFRRKTLGLEPIDSTWAPGMVTRLRIPHTYLWSPSLISKPQDWGLHVTIAGFCFLPSASGFALPSGLLDFLHDGPPPIYIGFGSIVVDNPEALTATVFQAIKLAGVRAIVAHGWADLGSLIATPPDIFLLHECPHDWLFSRVSCVVHHGGAGTTAAGLAAGRPSVLVPFFGDQTFWGNMIARAGAGPPPLPAKTLTATNLAAAIRTALSPATLANAGILAKKINTEQGAEIAARSFHDHLPLNLLDCCLVPQKPAVWQHRSHGFRLSALAATVLRKEALINFQDLELSRPCTYILNHGPWEPISGGGLAVSSLFYNVFKAFGEIGADFVRLSKTIESSSTLSSSEKKNKITRVTYPVSETTKVGPPSHARAKPFGSGTLKGFTRIFKATVRAPMTFTLGMAQGAHNAPRLWGDTTVRPQQQITGLGSGLLAAGKELFLGTYDGITGLFIQPYIGARDDGVLGAVKGLAKGVAGTPVKFFAAMSGSTGYPLKGLDMEIQKLAKRRKGDQVVKARVVQGEREWMDASEGEKKGIVERWVDLITEGE